MATPSWEDATDGKVFYGIKPAIETTSGTPPLGPAIALEGYLSTLHLTL
jgi:hypothetical protein